MKIIAVDDERIALEGLMDAIREAAPTAQLNGFEYPEDALAFVDENDCDIAFLDIEMSGMSGVRLAEQLELRNPNINIIFATGFEEYRKDAFDLHASGYLTKPITAEKVDKELSNLRHPIPKRTRLRVQAFGSFEVFVDDTPIAFKYSKTKEMFAYLIDRKGALCTLGELQAVLFDGEEGHEEYLRSLRRDLISILNLFGCENILAQQRGKLGVIPSQLECDYYDWCNGKRSSNVWRGEYMVQYSWSEYTSVLLNRMNTSEK